MGTAELLKAASWELTLAELTLDELTLFDLREVAWGLADPGSGPAVVDYARPVVAAPAGNRERARFDWPGGEPTLDDLIVDAWEGLAACATVACPVCGGRMDPDPQRNPQPQRGVCRDCGTSLG